jgi:hypothetical protein
VQCRKGGNAPPSLVARALSLRDTQGVSPIRLRGFVCRAAVSVASGTNGQEGADPSDGERLPTRSKPSKGVALVGMRTSSDLSSDGDDGLHGNPANPMSGTGMQHARSSRCGVNRRSGEIPQGRNENRGWQTAVRTRASARVEWTRVSTSEEGHPTIPREEDLAARGDLLPGPTGNTR